jgi:hypothetical protein
VAADVGRKLAMTTKARRYVAGAAAGAALTVSLAGCAGDGKAGGGMRLTGAQEALGRASQQTGDVTSFRATLATSTVASGRQTTTKGDLTVRLKPAPAMKLDVPSVNVAGRPAAGLQEILVGDTVYLRSPAIAKRAGKPWVSFSLSKLGEAAGIDVKGLESQGNPALNARMLTASKDAREVGRETVDGVPTTHYRGTFALKDAVAKLGTNERSQAEKVFGRFGLDRLLFDTWIDGRQLPRRLTLATPPGAKLRMSTTMDDIVVNAPVSITPPPAGQVKDGDAG